MIVPGLPDEDRAAEQPTPAGCAGARRPAAPRARPSPRGRQLPAPSLPPRAAQAAGPAPEKASIAPDLRAILLLAMLHAQYLSIGCPTTTARLVEDPLGESC